MALPDWILGVQCDILAYARLGNVGMPRRTHSYTVESGFAEYNMVVSIFSFIFGLSQLLLVWNIIKSNRSGEPASNDPWGGWSLEWATTSPPPTLRSRKGDYFHTILKGEQGDKNEEFGHHPDKKSIGETI